LLEFQPFLGRFQRNHENPLDFDTLIVDETSMVDAFLFDALLDALPKKTRLLLVGDKDQLPPVGPGQVFKDLIQ
jgi:exodeoxyribonuclease V alpha subunit